MNEEQTAGDVAPVPPRETNHISTVRRHLIEQMQALRSAKEPDNVRQEIDRSKGLADLAQAVVNTAKVEVEYLRATGQNSTPFLEVPPDQPYIGAGAGESPPSRTPVERLPGNGNGISSIVRHRLR